MTMTRERGAGALPAPVLLLIGVFAVAIFGQGGYYPAAQALLAVGLVLAVLATLRTRGPPWSELRYPPVLACGALAVWALLRATLGGEPSDASGYVLMLAGVAAVIVVCGRTTKMERDVLLDALTALAAIAALTGLIGVAWHYSPWALGYGPVWRAATTLTYMNAAAGLLVPVGLLALGRLADEPRSRVRAAAACVILAGAAATLSRAGALAFVVGAAVLAGLIGPRRFARAAGPPALGAAIAWAGLLPSIVHPHPTPAIAVLALVAGLAAATVLARPPSLATRRVAVAAVVAAMLALGAGVAAGGGLSRIRADRLTVSESERSHAGTVALRIAGQHPLAGVGPRHATLAWAGPGSRTFVARYAHDEYLQVLAELGAIGLALLVGLLAALALQVWRARRWVASPGLWAGIAAALVAAAVHGGFDFLWHVPAVVLVCAALAGAARSSETATAVVARRYRRPPLREQQPKGSVVT